MSKRLVADCLGRTRQILCVYADGSYSCPFCCSAVPAGRIGCSNPECFARGGDLPPFPREKAEKILRAARQRAELERAERAAWEAEQLREAERRGACVTCARRAMRFDERKVKFVKHRKQCPHDK